MCWRRRLGNLTWRMRFDCGLRLFVGKVSDRQRRFAPRRLGLTPSGVNTDAALQCRLFQRTTSHGADIDRVWDEDPARDACVDGEARWSPFFS